MGTHRRSIRRLHSVRSSASLFGAVQNSNAVVQAAYDIGSGLIKCQVAEVDHVTGRLLRVIYEGERKCLLRQSMAMRSDGKVGAEALAKCAEEVRDLKHEAEMHGATSHAAIATAVFREALDGPDFLQAVIHAELGLDAKIISQEMEGKLGYLTAVVLANAAGLCKNTRDVIAWDSGGGSFQISGMVDGTLQVWGGPLGSASTTAIMVERIQGLNFAEIQSPNPCTLQDCRALSKLIELELGSPPHWLVSRSCAQDAAVVLGIGSSMGAFGNCFQACGQNSWTPQQLWLAVGDMAGSTDDHLANAGYSTVGSIIPKLVLVYTIMNIAQIPTVRFMESNGSCAGMHVCREFWECQ